MDYEELRQRRLLTGILILIASAIGLWIWIYMQ